MSKSKKHILLFLVVSKICPGCFSFKSTFLSLSQKLISERERCVDTVEDEAVALTSYRSERICCHAVRILFKHIHLRNRAEGVFRHAHNLVAVVDSFICGCGRCGVWHGRVR